MLTRFRIGGGNAVGGDQIENGQTGNDGSELQAILTAQADLGVCLLRDSPFRILRVSNITL